MTHGKSVVVPVERVKRYLDRLAKSRQHDQERIHAFDLGEPSEAELFVSDLRSLVSAPAPAPSSLAGGEVLKAVLDHIDIQTCTHENTKRGGTIWTICEDCGRKWADDEGGFKPHIDAPAVAAARAYLAALSPEAPAREGGDRPWIEWGGGENPVPGQMVQIIRRYRKDLPHYDLNYLSDSLGTWEHRPMGHGGADDIIAYRLALTPRHEAPASDEVSKQRDEAIRIAKRLHDTVESLIYGLPKYLNDTAQTDEENMIGKAWHVFDAAAYGLAALPEVEPVQDLHELPQSVHEAPAEGAGEREGLIMALNIVTDPGIITGLRTAEDARYWIERSLQSALRARSSAPEAREEALGNLLAVIHGDGGHRALEVGTKQAALEAEKIVAGLFAAPSADKLRIAVEAMQGAIEWDKRTGYRMPYRVRDPIYAAIDLSTPDAMKGDAKP